MFEDELIDEAGVIEIRKEVTDVLYREKNKQRHAFQSYGLVVQKFWDKIIEDDFIDEAGLIEIIKEVTDVLYKEKGKQTHAFLSYGLVVQKFMFDVDS